MAQQIINLLSRRTQVQSLAVLSGLRIQLCPYTLRYTPLHHPHPELWCRLQMHLGSSIAVAMTVAVAGSCSSGVALRSKTKTKTKKEKIIFMYSGHVKRL